MANSAIVSLSARLAHRGEDRAHDNVTALIGRFLRAEGEAVEHGAHDLVQREPAVQVQFGREAHLGVDNAVAREVDGALGGDALELVPRLHDGRRVGEAFEVAHEVAAGRVGDEPTTQLVWVVGRQPVIVHLVGEFEDRLGPQPAVEMLVEQNFWRLADELGGEGGASWIQASERARLVVDECDLERSSSRGFVRRSRAHPAIASRPRARWFSSSACSSTSG